MRQTAILAGGLSRVWRHHARRPTASGQSFDHRQHAVLVGRTLDRRGRLPCRHAERTRPAGGVHSSSFKRATFPPPSAAEGADRPLRFRDRDHVRLSELTKTDEQPARMAVAELDELPSNRRNSRRIRSSLKEAVIFDRIDEIVRHLLPEQARPQGMHAHPDGLPRLKCP